MPTIQYTLRSVPEHVDKVLREKADQEGKSLNTVLLESLERGLGLQETPKKYHDLDEFFGTMEPDDRTDAALRQFDVIDEEVWR